MFVSCGCISMVVPGSRLGSVYPALHAVGLCRQLCFDNKSHEKRNMFYVIFGNILTDKRNHTKAYSLPQKHKKGLPWKISLQARSRHFFPYIMIQCIGRVECFAPYTAAMLCVHADIVASCVPNVVQPVQSL